MMVVHPSDINNYIYDSGSDDGILAWSTYVLQGLLIEYDKLFHIESSPEDKEMLDNLNVFVSLILPDINAGRTPDIEKHAARPPQPGLLFRVPYFIRISSMVFNNSVISKGFVRYFTAPSFSNLSS